jgi:hypothetical protein
MDIELKELSNIYLQTLKEQEDGAGQNPQQSVDVGSHAKAIRYQARRDNVPLPKAFNDYVAKNQLSGAERTALRQKLGFMESTEMVEEKKCNHTKEGKECPEHGIKDCPMDEQEENTEITEIHGQAHKPHEVPTGDIKKLVKKAVKRIDTDVDGDTDKNDKAKGELGEFIPGVGNKRLYSTTRTKTAKESFSDWRGEIRELVDVTSSKPKTDEKSREKISEKKIKNKIVINPPQGMTEAIEQLGGQILEMVEIEEGDFPKDAPSIKDTKPTKKTDVKYDPHMKVMAPTVKKEEVEEVDEAAGSTSTNDAQTKRQLAAKEQMMRKQHMLSRQRLQMQKQGKLPSGHMEGLSIDDQMRISREANAKRKPYEPGDRQKQRAAQIKQMAKNSSKDTRTDAQKMTDATGPRPGSRYRGD